MSRAVALLIAVVASLATGCRSVNPTAKLEDAMVYAPMAYPDGNWQPEGLLMHNRMNSLEKIANYHGPVRISHGDADRVIPFEHGQQLYEAAPGPKRFVRILQGDHNDPQTAECGEALDELLAALPPAGRQSEIGYR